MPIIELTKTNDKGEKVKYFTDTNYFNQGDINRLDEVLNSASKFRTTASILVGLASYHAFNYVPAVKTAVTSKMTHRSAGSFLALGAAALTYFVASFGVMSRMSTEQKRIISKTSHPGWYDRNSVVNPERTYFELDDANHNKINIIHSGLSSNNVKRLFPDFIVGELPSKPVEPVAEHHH